jgi:hypothetical protein
MFAHGRIGLVDKDFDAIRQRTHWADQVVADAARNERGQIKLVHVETFQRAGERGRWRCTRITVNKVPPPLKEALNARPSSSMYQPFEPGAYVRLPSQPDWGIGQVQSAIGNRVTVNFENAGKRTLDTSAIDLEVTTPDRG